MPRPDRGHAIDHVVVVMFENRSFDNLLGRLYRAGRGRVVRGRARQGPVATRSRPGPSTERTARSCRTASPTNMDTPDPDPGEEYQHVNTQLFGIIDPPANRGVLAEKMVAPFNAPAPGQRADDGRVRRRLHQRLHRRDGPPADLRRVRPDHDRLHARADAGPVGAGPRVRHLRPLVLRSAVADLHQPVVLPRRHGIGLRRQPLPAGLLPGPQHRRDDLRPPGIARA